MPKSRANIIGGLAWLLLRAAVAVAMPAVDGSWTGTLDVGATGTSQAVSVTLTHAGATVAGSVAIAGHVTVPVDGTLRGNQLRLTGASATERFHWRAHWSAKRSTWRGRVAMRNAGSKLRGRLGVVRANLGDSGGGTGSGPVACGADYFAAHVLPDVMQPICANCHVAGGIAQSARLRVTIGDPVATAATAILLVDQSAPAQSLLLLKPRADVPHGGGKQIAAGDASDQILQHWIQLVTAPSCAGSGGGGGNGGGTTGDLFLDDCAVCHGTAARGLTGPDIHCSRDITDAVRNGRSGALGTMPAFPNLSDADLAALQARLDGFCPAGTATGSDLFAGNCATCHGADAGGVAPAPSIRCATLVPDAVQVGRGTRMPAFPSFGAADLTLVESFLDQLCTAQGRTGADLYAGNCSSCHGATGNGGHNGLGVHGPNIRCQDSGELADKIQFGEDGMPRFPALDATDIDKLVDFLNTGLCSGD